MLNRKNVSLDLPSAGSSSAVKIFEKIAFGRSPMRDPVRKHSWHLYRNKPVYLLEGCTPFPLLQDVHLSDNRRRSMNRFRCCECEMETQVYGVLRHAVIQRDFFQPRPMKHSLQVFHFIARKGPRPGGFHA